MIQTCFDWDGESGNNIPADILKQASFKHLLSSSGDM